MLSRLGKKIVAFWDNIGDNVSSTEILADPTQEIHGLLSRKRELVAAMKANRLANKQEWFRRMFGLDRNPTNETAESRRDATESLG